MSISIFNLVSKLLNVPLLNITTSFVAEEQALISKSNDGDFYYLLFIYLLILFEIFFDV